MPKSELEELNERWSNEYATETEKLNRWLSEVSDRYRRLRVRAQAVADMNPVRIAEGHAFCVFCNCSSIYAEAQHYTDCPFYELKQELVNTVP